MDFQVWPENVEVSTAITRDALAPGTYYYVFCYEWTNNQGNLGAISTSYSSFRSNYERHQRLLPLLSQPALPLS